MTAPDIETPPGIEFAIDSDAPPSDAPKRRGRPPGSRNATTRATTDRAPRRKSRTWVKEQVASLVGLLNLGLVAYPPTRGDALDEREMDLLTDAVAAECMSSERVLAWLGRVSGVSAHVLLIQAIVLIAIPRLQRRGILPTLPGANDGGNIPAETNLADAVATGRTPGVGWQNGQWQNNNGERSFARPPEYAVPGE